MAIDNFKTAFVNSYQEIFQKVMVAMKIANTRLLSDLTYGQSVERVKYDISGVSVQDITVGVDMTVDSVTDSNELLTINKWKGTIWALSEKEKVQAGPLNPGTVIGAQIAKKLAIYVDADVLAETINAFASFDNGTLTSLANDGTPITLTSTTVPQAVTRMNAFLQRNNQELVNLCWVLDPIALADIWQFLLGKNADFAKTVLENGYVGETIAGAQVYVSNNLTGEAVLTGTGTFSNGETVTIGGVVFTARTALTPAAGEFLIGANLAASLTNLTGLINAPGTTNGTQVALSAADQVTISKTLRLAATATATTITLVGTGSGRLVVADTAANASFTSNFIHSYYGRKGAIDVVVQKEVNMEMRQEPKQPTENILCRVLYGHRVFTDGSQKYLDVKIAS